MLLCIGTSNVRRNRGWDLRHGSWSSLDAEPSNVAAVTSHGYCAPRLVLMFRGAQQILQEWCVSGMTLIGWAGYGVYEGFFGRYDWIEVFLRTIYEPPRIKYRRDVIGPFDRQCPEF